MSKLTLDIDELKVDSFDTGDEQGGRGTVRGNAALGCTCWDTCGGSPNCETSPPYC